MNSLDFHSEQSYPIQVVLEASQAPQNRRILSKGNISVLKALCSKGDGRQRCCSDHRCQSYSWNPGIPAGAHRKVDGKMAKPFLKLHLSQVAFSPLLDGLGWKRRSAIVPRSPSSTVAKKVSISCSEHLINKLKISVTKTPISANLTLCVYMFHIYIYIYQFSCIFPKDISPWLHPATLR